MKEASLSALKHGLFFFVVMVCLVACGSDGDESGEQLPPATGSANLAIAPTYQQTQYWCWAAAAEMVLRHYNMPNINPVGNYQCGIVAAWFTYAHGNIQCGFNCAFCPYPIDSMSSEHSLITGYGQVARLNFIASPILTAALAFGPLSAQRIKAEIDAGKPILAGISPGSPFIIPNTSAHAAVIVGYDFESSTQFITVNDPYPFDLAPYDPYVVNGGVQTRRGQYRIPLAAFVTALAWGNSIYDIRVSQF